MGHPDRSDAELLAAHVAGDRFAFGELYGRHQRRLRRLARLTTGCPEDAEDALQEAMLSAHRGAGAFRYNAAVGSWLHRIVVNACLDRLRRSRIQPTEPLGEDCAVGDRTAEVETALEVHAALRRLPPEQRAAVAAVDMHGYSVADAADALGVPQGTVKSRCARGRARLAVLLGRDHTGAAGSVAPAGRRITLAPDGAMRSRVDDCA
ncbi:RNA polymerase sigma factor SigM [Mycolicibacter sinensis]|jgi:RNA polymerase sigma-70 factor (ECF subfamily)|uniref:RNA polymerase sigma factor SigM n=1 Tax=Mycolicibacter sinensis (strain JDM601) TaxID=875328 RepID=A0A1A2EG11_MYCSD|nr:RNA polymerase sigma factor SigM [Mycolicibacter sinensis]OBG04102.1 RNA polymerase sigma factor SigM [Mycolicibacter sinensis]OBG08594.1 RNA polymerase sigma factor SigM [Mycolicibacter sinensis]